ncbi:hypothetical protein [Microbulbifer pacificus]|uniref:hypothetical protein n=1 Tax=Microbulbifer pacificus TaxID=407164 RepID=UPI001F225E1E|nr:hypothetical protein [Microbulbifer pacificus]
MPSVAPALAPVDAPAFGMAAATAVSTEDSNACPQGIISHLGGRQFLSQTVGEFYQAVGKYMASEDCVEHDKQRSRQAQFLHHALAEESEPTYSARASFLARGLNPALFEALLEYLEARLLELGCSSTICDQLVRTVSTLFDRCDDPMSIAC